MWLWLEIRLSLAKSQHNGYVRPRYGIPCNAPGVLQIICSTGEVRILQIDMESWQKLSSAPRVL